MGDSGEGLVDAEARIHERMDELARERQEKNALQTANPEQARAFQSLRLARLELEQQRRTTAHDRRKTQLDAAIAEIDKQLALE